MFVRQVICSVGIAASLASLGEAVAQSFRFNTHAALEMNSLSTGVASSLSDPQDAGNSPNADRLPGRSGLDTSVHMLREPRGNPLWAIPLASLNASRERPIFLPARRPPMPAQARAEPRAEPASPPPVTIAPPRPDLALIGVAVGDSEAIAVFIDRVSGGTVRLRSGESYSGWILHSARGREATLQKERETIVLALPAAATKQGEGSDQPALPAPPPAPARARTGPPPSPGITVPPHFKGVL
jgi:hypothetical protein